MSRVLTIHEIKVPGRERESYVRDLRGRKAQLRSQGCNFWVFERAGERGIFVEFVEAPDEAALAAAGVDRSAPIMTEVDLA